MPEGDCDPVKIVTFVKNCSLWEEPVSEKFGENSFPWVEHHTGAGEAEMPLKPVVKMMVRSSSLQPWRTRMDHGRNPLWQPGWG